MVDTVADARSVPATATTPDDLAKVSGEKLRWMYRTMLRIRHFESRVKQLFLEARLYGSVHLYIGEEAVAAGACAALGPDDLITSTHRGHGHCLARDMEMAGMMAELMGKATGYCKGKGGSMHIADLDHGMLGANGIVGAGLPIATGAALGNRMLGNDRVTVSFFGDGAANQGAFHEALNLAAVLKAAVVFVCENNQFAQFHRVEQDLPIKDVATRAGSYGIPGAVVDGQDVIAVHRTVEEAVERARRGDGPSLIECKTYRYEGHFLGDQEVYRSKEEVAEQRANDPIPSFHSRLLAAGLLTAAEAEAIDASVRQEVEEAVRFGEESPLPDEALVHTDLFTDE